MYILTPYGRAVVAPRETTGAGMYRVSEKSTVSGCMILYVDSHTLQTQDIARQETVGVVRAQVWIWGGYG